MARPQLDIRIGDLQTRTIPAVAEHLSMAAARKVAGLKRVAFLFVEREGQLVGTLDERVLATARDGAGVAASMLPTGPCLNPEMSVARACELFAWSRVSMLPVTVGTFLVGALARTDVEQALARQQAVAAARRRAATPGAAAA
jgi:CBS domain-containing protein